MSSGTCFVRSFLVLGGKIRGTEASTPTCDLGDGWVFGRPFILRPTGAGHLEEMLRNLDGKFSVVLRWGEEWVVATDLLGAGPLYYREDTARVVLGTHLGPVARAAPLELDERATMVAAMTGIALGGQTPYASVRRLLGGEYLVLDQSMSRIVRRGRYAALEAIAGGPQRSRKPGNPQKLAKLIGAAVAREGRVGALFLSGGQDSQAVALGMRKRRRASVTALTYGGWRSFDRLAAPYVAEQLGMPSLEVGPRELDPFDHWDTVVELGGGSVGLQATQHIAGAAAAGDLFPVALHGYLGDALTGMHFATTRSLRGVMAHFTHLGAAYSAALRHQHPQLYDQAVDAFEQELARWSRLSFPRRHHMVNLLHRQPQRIAETFTLMHHHVEIANPFYNRSLIRYLLTRDAASLRDQALYRETLRRMGRVDPAGLDSRRLRVARLVDRQRGGYQTVDWARILRRHRRLLGALVSSIEHPLLRSLAELPDPRRQPRPLSLFVIPIAATLQPDLLDRAVASDRRLAGAHGRDMRRTHQ